MYTLGLAYNEFAYNEVPATTNRFLYHKPIDSNAKYFGCNEHLLHLYTRCKRNPVFNEIVLANGLFTLPDLDSDSNSDSKPYGYIVLFRTFHIGSDPDPDPYSDGFPNVTF